MIKCPKCNNKKNVLKVLHIQLVPKNLNSYQANLKQKKTCFGPNDKNFYCEKCDLYFN